MEQLFSGQGDQLFRRFAAYGILPEVVRQMRYSWEYEAFSGLVRGIQTGCTSRIVRWLAKKLFTTFKEKEREMIKGLSQRDAFEVHRLLRVCFPAYRLGYRVL